MPEWKRQFKAHPIEASRVRAWTADLDALPDAPQVANELFVGVLGAGPDIVEMTLSAAGNRLRITATGDAPLSLRHSHGPGWRIVAGLSRSTGVTTDELGLWAQLEAGR